MLCDFALCGLQFSVDFFVLFSFPFCSVENCFSYTISVIYHVCIVMDACNMYSDTVFQLLFPFLIEFLVEIKRVIIC